MNKMKTASYPKPRGDGYEAVSCFSDAFSHSSGVGGGEDHKLGGF